MRERVPGLLPPFPPVAGARAGEPSRRPDALRVRELVPPRAHEVAGTARMHDEHDQRQNAGAHTRSAEADRESPPPDSVSLAVEQVPRGGTDDARAAHERSEERRVG